MDHAPGSNGGFKSSGRTKVPTAELTIDGLWMAII